MRSHHSNTANRLAFAFILFAGVVACSSAPSSVEVEAGPVALRRLTSEQFARSIHDALGEHITVPSRIDPDDRRDGLLAVGASFASVTPSGFEKYEAAAAAVAEQALDEAHRDDLVQCEPVSPSAADPDCARPFIERVGRRLLRRSLTADEANARVAIANESAEALDDFYTGLELALVSLLVSPEFLFRVEVSEPDPANPATSRLTSVSMASRISYLLWDSTPDDELLDAAANGELVTDEGLAAQVERMLLSPKLDRGIRAFFSDLYDFKQFDEGLVRKDGALFPVFTQAMIEEAKEQTLRTIVAHLTEDRDYRDLFTTQETYMTRRLGVVYRLPVATSNGWERYVFPDESLRAGLLSHVSFNALHSHPGRSSATLRGKFVREVLLCQDIPTPPANIDFSIVEDTTGEIRTARERLEKHVSSSACSGCHTLTDPIGLALENFDAVGMYRAEENGVTIDPSGELDGITYANAVEMGRALRDNPALGPCLVKSLFRYAVGREPVDGEEDLLTQLHERFADSQHRVTELLREIVVSPGFRTTSGPRQAEASGGES